MSGGSMNYLYSKILDAEFNCHTSERIAFKKHLQLIAYALHDIEWVDSGDYSAGDENEAIMRCISKSDVLASIREDVKDMLSEASKFLEE